MDNDLLLSTIMSGEYNITRHPITHDYPTGFVLWGCMGPTPITLPPEVLHKLEGFSMFDHITGHSADQGF